MSAQGLGRLIGVLDILLHDGGTGEQDLALLTAGQFLVRAGLDDLDISIREGNADAALLGLVYRCEAAGSDGLGGTVALTHLNDGLVIIEKPVELLLELYRQGIAAGEHALETAQIGVVHIWQPQQRLIQRGHARNEIAAVLGDKPGIALRREARHQHAAPAVREHGVDAHAEAEAVEQRHGREHLVARAVHRVGGENLLAQGVEVEVRQQDPLGAAGGAAGVEDDRGIVRPALDLVVPEAGLAQAHELVPHDDGRVLGDLPDLAALGEHVAHAQRPGERVPDPGKDDVDDLGVLADGLELVVELIEGHDRDRLGLVDVELQLLLAGEGVDHVRHGADHVHGVEHVDGLRAVRHGDGDAVVLAHADGAQAARAFLDVREHVAVGGGPAHEVEGDGVGVLLRRVLDHVHHGAVEVFQRGGHVAEARQPGSLRGDFHSG